MQNLILMNTFGIAEDVTHSAFLDVLQVVPILQNGRFVNFVK